MMWKSFESNKDPFITKAEFEENYLHVSLSNLKIIWREIISLESTLERFKEINPTLESTEEGVKDHIITTFNDIDKALAVEIVLSEANAFFTFTSKLGLFNVKLKFFLEKLPGNTFFSEVTVPLLKTVRYLEQSQVMMVDLLKKKDREIEEYVLEKGNISRDDLVTKPFQSNAIKNSPNDTLMLNIFGHVCWSKFAEKIDDIEAESNRIEDGMKHEISIKRKVYSARTSNKKRIV